MDNSGKLVWFAAGASIGATLALLFAPQSGRATRRYLDRHTRKGRRALSEVGRDAVDRGRDALDRGRDLLEKGREMADEAASVLDRGRQLFED